MGRFGTRKSFDPARVTRVTREPAATRVRYGPKTVHQINVVFGDGTPMVFGRHLPEHRQRWMTGSLANVLVQGT